MEKLIKNKEFGKRLFSTYISVSQELPNAVDKGITIFDSLRDNSAKIDIDLFVRESLQLDSLRNGKKPTKPIENFSPNKKIISQKSSPSRRVNA